MPIQIASDMASKIMASSIPIPFTGHCTPPFFVIAVHFGRRLVLIGGTQYAGEIKKSIFSTMNYLLPFQDVLPMHCSSSPKR